MNVFQLRLLRALKYGGELTAAQLCRATSTHPAAARRALASLVDGGYIDRGLYFYSLSAQGREFIQEKVRL